MFLFSPHVELLFYVSRSNGYRFFALRAAQVKVGHTRQKNWLLTAYWVLYTRLLFDLMVLYLYYDYIFFNFTPLAH